MASWYGLEEKGRPTASGEIMDPERFTAAHRTLAFGTLLRVTDVDTGLSVLVTVNDRGPFVPGRIVDLSYGAARALGIVEKGLAKVEIRVMAGKAGSFASRRWRVQVGSFSTRERAQQHARNLEREGYTPVHISIYREGRRSFYRVWVGEFDNRSDAERLARTLRRKGHQTIVVNTSPDLSQAMQNP